MALSAITNRTLIGTLSANGALTTYHTGADTTYYVVGTFGSGNVVIASSPDSSNYIEENAATASNFNWTLGAANGSGMEIRFTLAGSTSPTVNVYAFIGDAERGN